MAHLSGLILSLYFLHRLFHNYAVYIIFQEVLYHIMKDYSHRSLIGGACILGVACILMSKRHDYVV